MKTIRFMVMYLPFQFDEPGVISTEVKIFVDEKWVETWESNDIIDGEQLDKLKKEKREHYGI